MINKNADQQNSEYEFNSPKAFNLWAPGSNKKFTRDYIYMGFLCNNPVTVDVLIRFNTEEKALGKKKEEEVVVEVQDEEKKIVKKVSVYTEAETKALKRISQSIERARQETSTHLIKRNMESAFKWKEIYEQKVADLRQGLPKKVRKSAMKLFVIELRT